MFDAAMLARAEALLARCRSRSIRLATAESCTGGMIAALCTEIPGSSDVLERGLVTYSNEAKQQLLGIPNALLLQAGAVSEEVARAMAEGALARAPVQLTVAVTGIAGPGGATPSKPVGLVHLAAAAEGRATLHRRHEFGDLGRSGIRLASVVAALALLEQQLT